jgi:large subunit ribosomal protein L18
MARGKITAVPHRRKRKGKTDYKKRLKLLLARKPRIVIRKSLKNTWLQVVEYSPSGDKIVLSAHSSELKKLGWNAGCGNIPAAYLTGLLLGKKAAEKKIKECVLDIGLYASIKGSRIYASLKGAVDAGLAIPFSEEIAPPEERIKGAHIAEFAKKAKEIHASQFSLYQKNNVNPEEITKQFEEVKEKIKGMKNG